VAASLFIRRFHSKRREHVVVEAETARRSILHELKIWGVLSSRVWHLFLFVFMLSLVDATFWSVGAVLSEELQNSGEHGLLLVLYGLPTLFLGFLAGRAAQPFGKKRAAFLLSAVGGIVLTMVGLVDNENLLLVLVFIASCFFAISWPEIYAVFEDYVVRLGKTGNDFIGLQSSIVGLSYVIGPIFAGVIASVVGHQATFAVVGVMLTLTSLLVLVITPRKIKMPQAQLKEL
jgi:MFS family permease